LNDTILSASLLIGFTATLNTLLNSLSPGSFLFTFLSLVPLSSGFIAKPALDSSKQHENSEQVRWKEIRLSWSFLYR